MARAQDTTAETAVETADGAAPAAGGAVIGYEQARDELVDVVRRLEAGGTTLEEALALWERGEELARVCRHWLEGARARLDAALAREGGGADGEDGAPDGDRER
ncbi:MULTISPECIES: exodeoxyribonuclease VII small subunit [Streptomyces]|uniref:Exodeoxyribonuclease 7 small subunit n=1 Tax=Streptomyces sudanensis TaxID=436397 RepID=A0ABY4TEH9_9ACTN|nr:MULTISPECIES: exodeoxyribonuclease VII small subunit [Streptomyces]MCP9957494.1 exodeoxyribonuclease VII small subunit [Streptomyces sudanensis]MCQ0001960.1 exodeoxyribonuclease VII small subunit [Streptomyces sudanensis]URN15197.1 exodeoxyribonuclease VII small subunit [Streptomyces sudanensis]